MADLSIGVGEIQPLIAWQDARNAAVLQDIIDRPLRERTEELTKAREAYTRKLLERRLPRFLHWTLDHPRALQALLRFVPRWRLTIAVIPLDPFGSWLTDETAQHEAKLWLQKMDGSGRKLRPVYVFTYTDANGLPAEVYGP